MVKTQIQLPEELYEEAKRVAREREMSLADVIRQGVEYITTAYPPLPKRRKTWLPPPPSPMGEYLIPPEEWRLLVNDPSMDRQTGRE